MLSTIAGSMMTVVGVTFSMVLVALALASSQYSSRILRNFTNDRVTQVVLGIFAVGIIGLKSDGLNNTQSFTTKPDAITGQHLYDENFNVGAGAPAQIIADSSAQSAVVAAVRQVNGVADIQAPIVVRDKVLIQADL